MNVRYRVTLEIEERDALETMVRRGKVSARRLKRAQILLAADRGSTDETIAANVSVGTSTVYRTKRRFVEEGFEGRAQRGASARCRQEVRWQGGGVVDRRCVHRPAGGSREVDACPSG